jgi:hypothetical protein
MLPRKPERAQAAPCGQRRAVEENPSDDRADRAGGKPSSELRRQGRSKQANVRHYFEPSEPMLHLKINLPQCPHGHTKECRCESGREAGRWGNQRTDRYPNDDIVCSVNAGSCVRRFHCSCIATTHWVFLYAAEMESRKTEGD